MTDLANVVSSEEPAALDYEEHAKVEPLKTAEGGGPVLYGATSGGSHVSNATSKPKEIAYRKLKEDIVLGRHAFGAVLSPRRLGKEMGMSFLPVADALRVLEAEGLVETRDRVGTRVRVPTPELIRGIYVLREAFESQSARLCAQQMTPALAKQLKSMARKVDQMYAQVNREPDDLNLCTEARLLHTNFHRYIAESAECPILTEAIERSQVLAFKLMFDSALRRKQRPRDWHLSFASAIASGDPLVADQAARHHISHSQGIEEVLRSLEGLQLQDRWRLSDGTAA